MQGIYSIITGLWALIGLGLCLDVISRGGREHHSPIKILVAVTLIAIAGYINFVKYIFKRDS